MLMRTLLPARRERPCGSCATEKRDELTTLHVLPSVEDHTLPHYRPALCITAKMAVDVSCGSFPSYGRAAGLAGMSAMPRIAIELMRRGELTRCARTRHLRGRISRRLHDEFPT